MYSKSILDASLLALPKVALSAYTLQDDYSGNGMWDMFDFYTGEDPTNGLVSYVDQSTAQSSGLIKETDGGFYIGVDNTNSVGEEGRPSVRLESKNSYESGLIILDLAHMPSSACGTWPAFWTTDPTSWPDNGEIDIIENVNNADANQMTLHTGPGCAIGSQSGFSGSPLNTDCDVSSGSNTGCGISDPDQSSYGDGFNDANGGVFATEITASTISIWHFPSDSIPADIKSDNPDPSTWTMPVGRWQGGCNVADSFNAQKIIFDITFCGDWAGQTYGDAGCPSTCEDTVMNSPETFSETFWQVNSLKVYSGSGGNGTNGSYPTCSLHQRHGRHASHLLQHFKS